MMLRTFALAASSTLFTVIVAACGSDSAPLVSPGSPPDPGFSGRPIGPLREPAVHRPSEEPCTEPRPPFGGFGDPVDECAEDVDCTEGVNGRCVADLGKPAFCSYDECAADADCGEATACACRIGPRYFANACVKGSCRVDSDCGSGGFCSPSGLSLSTSCLNGVALGQVGFFCHTSTDECVDDADCGGENVCLFSVSSMHWRCHQLQCTN